jgi:hypothetical protein
MTEVAFETVPETDERESQGAKKPKPWQNLSPQQYRAMAPSLVHFSAKAVNTNATASGVRMAVSRLGRQFPYAAASTLPAGEVALDFHLSSPVLGVYPPAVARQINAVRDNTQAQYFTGGPGAEETTLIQELLTGELTQDFEAGSKSVSMRVKQILVPDADAGYLALTPLHSTGLARAVNRHRRNIIDNVKPAWLGLEPAILAFGGSNAQNIGLYAHEMRAAMLAPAPMDRPVVRRAIRLHHRGMALTAPRALCEQYAQWLLQQRRRHGGAMRNSHATRREERELIVRMGRMVLGLASTIRACIQPAMDTGKLEELTSPDLDAVVRATIDPSLRNALWARAFAQRVALSIVRFRYRRDGEDVSIGIEDSVAAVFADWIEEDVR